VTARLENPFLLVVHLGEVARREKRKKEGKEELSLGSDSRESSPREEGGRCQLFCKLREL